MDETLIFPSPNWFQASGFQVTSDEWLIYGGPSKSLCVLEPLPEDSGLVVSGNQGYQAHVAKSAHPEKIVCVDVSPEWPAKRAILTGSADGTVKQWCLERVNTTLVMKSTHSHDLHHNEREEIVGVGYCNNGYAVTVGCYGNIVKWDLNSNVMKNFNHVLKSFKPVCMACSPHVNLIIAIGTRQGVVFVLDLNGAARIVYKVRGQDDEILKVSWCPQYEVTVKKELKETVRKSYATDRMNKIRQEPEDPEVVKELDERVANSATVEHFLKKENVRGLQQTEIKGKKKTHEGSPRSDEELNESGIGKTLPEDSFDGSIVAEDDMFDIYKDHEADEFGHKKYQPEDIIVKIPDESKHEDYLLECTKLKEEILKRKTMADQPIEALVDALEKTHVEEATEKSSDDSKAAQTVTSEHKHKHLLATIGKHGSVRVWSKAGKLVGSCGVAGATTGNQRGQRHQRMTNWASVLWYSPETLLIADGKSQLLECNPLQIDCKNKLEWSLVHSLHKRGMFCIASSASRVRPPAPNSPMTDGSTETEGATVTEGATATEAETVTATVPDYPVWTAAQDRNLVKYSLRDRKPLAVYNTCGGFLYYVENCPYDAHKLAVAVGDGAARVWQAAPSDADEARLAPAKVATFWNNVQGKVLVVAWHPTKEYCLAFATAESRVGYIDTSKPEKPARVFLPVLSGGVYAISWGEGDDLYACGGGEMVVYNAAKPEEAPTAIKLSLEGAPWPVSTLKHGARLAAGSTAGAVAILDPARPHDIQTAVFVFSKMIHTIDWHPQQTSSSTEDSPHKNLMAVCSLDKSNAVAILVCMEKEDGSPVLTVVRTLAGHRGAISQVAWNPHQEGRLLSTSSDGTVRVWDAIEGVCLSIFGHHVGVALGAAWAASPALPRAVISGGADCALRLWDYKRHPMEDYQEIKHETTTKKEKKKKEKKEEDPDAVEGSAVLAVKVKSPKKFLLPVLNRQMYPCKLAAARRMLRKYLESAGDSTALDAVADTTEEFGLDFLKIFGPINDVNEVLDTEMEYHSDTGNAEAALTLLALRGRVADMVSLAAAKDGLDPYILSLAPGVSAKFWKDTTQLYLAQIDRFVAKGMEFKLCESRSYGGPVFRKALAQLAAHDVVAAAQGLAAARLFKEAYLLCRTRYIDSVAMETLQKWAEDSVDTCNYSLAAVCFIALGNLSDAATALGKSNDEDHLSLAAATAKLAGQNTFADHMEKKREQIISSKEEKEVEKATLPERAEILINEAQNALAAQMEKLLVDSDKLDKKSVAGVPEVVNTEQLEKALKAEDGSKSAVSDEP